MLQNKQIVIMIDVIKQKADLILIIIIIIFIIHHIIIIIFNVFIIAPDALNC